MKKKSLPLFVLPLLATVSSSFASENDIEYKFSGAISAVLFHDTNVTGAGVNNPSNGLEGKLGESDTKLDASLSQFGFQASQKLQDNQRIEGKIVMDFNASNNNTMTPRLREAYLSWHINNSKITAGQTWSTFMDMNNLPESVAEATVSGPMFKRQPMLRWSQQFNNFSYDVAIESGSNSNIILPDGFADDNTVNQKASKPDFLFALEWNDRKTGWVRATSLIRQAQITINSELHSEMAYGVQISGGVHLFQKDKLSFIVNTGKGVDSYLLGIHGAGPAWNEDQQELELRRNTSAVVMYARQWNNDLRSQFAYSVVNSDLLDWQSGDDLLTATDYSMVNLLWAAQKNMTVGVEYNYGRYLQGNNKEGDNHRFMVGMNWKF